jgi:hypothetical protein
MKKQNEFSDQIYSFRALRQSVGFIATALPFTIMLGVFLIFRGPLPLYSISQYYFSEMRDILVGALSAVALFLFFYKGYNRWDLWSANLAGVSALLTAIFPTVESGPSNLSSNVHFISAAIFFVTLACMSLFLFTKMGSSPTAQKLKRNMIYRGCGIIMFGCLIALVVFYKFFDSETSQFVFWTETLALVAFGVSWIVKGEAIFADAKNKGT